MAPDIVKPAPVIASALIVTGTVPVEAKYTTCGFATVFVATLPKATLVALICSVGIAAFNFRPKISETLPCFAVSTTACAVVTDDTVAVNAALVAFAGTVTVAGTLTAALLLARLTLNPPLGAAALSFTVQASVPDPIMDPLLQETAFNTTAVAALAVVGRAIRMQKDNVRSRFMLQRLR